jgi:inhibitor of cysteine peptidase
MGTKLYFPASVLVEDDNRLLDHRKYIQERSADMKRLIVMKLGLLLVAAIVGATVALAGSGDVVAVDGSFADKEIKLQVGDTLEVALESNLTTGFQWVLVENSDETALQQVGHVYVPYGNTNPPLPGVGGVELWSFKALKEGQSTIFMEYSQPWDGGIKQARTFTLTVVVK